MSGPNTNPTFARSLVVGRARISTANTNRDGTGTLGSVVTGGVDGTRIDRLVITATAATTAGMIRLFVDDLSVKYALKEVAVSAVASPSATVQTFSTELTRSDGLPVCHLPPGYILKAGTHNAESFDVLAFGGDL